MPLNEHGVHVKHGVPYPYYIVRGWRLRDLYVVSGVMETEAEAQLPGAPMLQISVKFPPSPFSTAVPVYVAVRTDKSSAGDGAIVCDIGTVAQRKDGVRYN